MKRTIRRWLLPLAAVLGVGTAPCGADGQVSAAAPASAERSDVTDGEHAADDSIAALVTFLERGDGEKERREARRDGEKRRTEGRGEDRRGGPEDRPRGERGQHRAERERARAEREHAADRPPVTQDRPSSRRPFDDGPPRVARPEMARPEVRRVAPLVRPQPHGQSVPMVPLVPAQPHVPQAAPAQQPGPGGVVVLPPQVRAFAIQVGPDGAATLVPQGAMPGGPMPGGPVPGAPVPGERRQFSVQIDGGKLKLEGVPGMNAPLDLGAIPGITGGTGPIQVEAKVLKLDGLQAGEGDAHAHVRQLLDRILDKVNAIESRLGGPGPQGPHGQPPHHPGMPPHQAHGMAGPQPPHGQPGPHGNAPHPGPQPGGVNPDEINRRFEVHARELHRRMEEMQRHLAERVQAGGGEAMHQWHQKLAETHEKIQQSFQDIRRRFAEQQERIERVEQELKKLRGELDRRGAADTPRGAVTH